MTRDAERVADASGLRLRGWQGAAAARHTRYMPEDVQSGTGFRVERLRLGEEALHRALRLQALADAPGSFGEEPAEIAARPHAVWQRLGASMAEGGRHAMFLVRAVGPAVGCVYAFGDATPDGSGRLAALWVHPAHRRRGAGALLVQAGLDWLRDAALGRALVWCPAQATAALCLWQRHAFERTGRERLHPTRAAGRMLELARPL